MITLHQKTLTQTVLFFIFFISGFTLALGQNRDFTPFIEELKNGHNIDEGDLLQEDDDFLFVDSSIELDGADYVFYVRDKSNGTTALTAAFNTTKVPESDIIDEIKASTGVSLEEIDNNFDILSYFIKKANQIIGVVELVEIEGTQTIQFYQVSEADIRESIARMASIIEPDNIGSYKGEQTDEELPIFSSSYQAEGATRSFFAEKLGATFIYTEFRQIKPYVFMALFGKELEPFERVGFTDISLKEEEENGGDLARYFFAKKSDLKYFVEVWDNQTFGMTIVANEAKPLIPDGVEVYSAPASFPYHNGSYQANSLGDLIGRHIEDPAVQGYLKQTGSVETYDGGDGFYTYEGNDITLDFYEKKLVTITLGKSYDWPYNTPKDNINNLSQSSLPYEESFHPYVSATKDGVEFMLYFDEDTKQIVEFRIQEE